MDGALDILFDDDGGELLEWKVTDGSFVRADGVLLVYRSAAGETKRLKTSKSGVISVDTTLRKGKELKRGMVMARVDDCKHAIVIKDMCASCGKDLRMKEGRAGQRIEASSANVSMIHHVPELIVSDELARKIGNRDQQNVLESRKLVLLVDLDQTLIHTTNHNFDMTNSVDIVRYKLKGSDFFTKLRPHTREFLEETAKMYEMHIISYGERQYAHRIADILDPNKVFFGHRIMSRDELFSAMYKTHNMRALFPCGDQLIVIIDDRPDVWQFSDALVQVKPYRFFKEIGDINAPLGVNGEATASETIAEADEKDDDDTLKYLGNILKKIHASFYQHYDEHPQEPIMDVKAVISEVRREVLRGCSVVLSGIVPIGVEPYKTEAYRLCVQFGATITENITDATTHVIAARWGTTKVHDARKREGIAVVNPKWLYACVERWEKADEKDFELAKDTLASTEKPLGGALVVGEFSNLETIGKETLRHMTDEVDEALSEGDALDEDEDAEDSAEAGHETGRKRKSDGNDESGYKREKLDEDDEDDDENNNSSTFGSESGSDDDMAADVERQLLN